MAFVQFKAPDGVFRSDFTLSTTMISRFLTGQVSGDIVDLEISFLGSEYASDSDLIVFDGVSFTLPNPEIFPDGFDLVSGSNFVKVRGIRLNGSFTSESVVDIRLAPQVELGDSFEAPSGIEVERKDSSVVIQFNALEDTDVQGYHVYATPQPGGGNVGFFRINPQMLLSGEVVERVEESFTLQTDITASSSASQFRFSGTQENALGEFQEISFREILPLSSVTENFRVETQISSVTQTTRFTFEHDRKANLSSSLPALPHTQLASVPETESLYYTVTAVYLVDGVEVESHFSQEVVAKPLKMTSTLGVFPQIQRTGIVTDMVESIYRSHPTVRVDPGSFLRDTVIDPFSTEGDRVRFIMDFLHTAQSFTTLLAIDDPARSGVSVPVRQSAYKLALRDAFFLPTDQAVQDLIDSTFDKLASNFGVIRETGKRSRGQVTFYTATPPSSLVSIPLGTVVTGQDVRFRTTSNASIDPNVRAASIDSQGRYSVTVFVQAEDFGVSGNLISNQITQIATPTVQGLSVTNVSRTFGGKGRQSNLDLAFEAQRKLASVDTGTLQGYVQNAATNAGVLQVSVVDSGHDLMQRDLVDGEHVGGKVDVYIRAEEDTEAQVTDTFAFAFESRLRHQFEPLGDLSNLEFRAVDSNLSTENPLIEVLSIDDLDLAFENITQGYVFDVTDIEIVGFNTVRLSSSLNDPIQHTLTDEIRGSYRYRTSEVHVLTQQPVIEILSFEGSRSGLLPESIYDLYRVSDPLGQGNSAKAGALLRVTDPLDSGVSIPSSDPIETTSEAHIMLDGPEYLNNLGVNRLTVRVFNSDRTVEYSGPLVEGDRDFVFVEGSTLGIEATLTGNITRGDVVLVDYSHDENFKVTYTTDATIGSVQEDLDTNRHITADVLTKTAPRIPVDINATIVLNTNTSPSSVDGALRTSLVRFFGALGLGDSVHPSDIVRVLDGVQGVSHVITPLSKMTRGDSSTVLRESISVEEETDFFHISAWSTNTIDVFLLLNPLEYSTSDAGGAQTDFRGVFLGGVLQGHQEISPNTEGVPLKENSSRAFIIGSGGLLIPDYSDNETLALDNVLSSDAVTKASQLSTLRTEKTQGRVLLSLPLGESPQGKQVEVTYLVDSDEGVRVITPSDVGYVTLGSVDFIFD